MKMVVDKASLVSVADAIREKGNTTDELVFPQGFVDAVGAIESGGGTEEIESIIDQSGVLGSTDGTVTEKVGDLIDKAKELEDWFNHFSNTFCTVNPNMGAVFKGYTGTKLPKFDVSKYKTIEGLCYDASNLEIIDFYLDYNGNSIYQLCQNTPKLKFIKGVNTSNTTFVSNAFYNSGVEEIEMPFDFSKVTTANNIFGGCPNLKEIRFVPETIKISITIPSPVLSDESIESILKGLAPVETTQLLSVNTNVLDRILGDKFFDLVSEVIDKGWEIS